MQDNLTIDKNKGVNVAMVGYHNTLPFLYGLEKDDHFKLILDIPSRCIDYFSNGEADIALVPVATLLDRDDYKIITNYGIGCDGEVHTVCLFTDFKISDVRKVYLDKDSRTSQMLVKVLCANHWNINPEYEECDVRNIAQSDLQDNEAILMIGDKVFGKENSYKSCFDLGSEWKKMTGLPFAFAVWIAKKKIDNSVIQRLSQSLSTGLNNIDLVLEKNKNVAIHIDLAEYFHNYIDFNFDVRKKQAFDMFFEYASALSNLKSKVEV